MRFVDTNVFIRYFTQDDPIKSAACLRLFQRVQGGLEELRTTEIVIAEVIYVLKSPRVGYRLSPADIRARLRPVLSLHGLKLPNKRAVLRALDLYAQYPALDFEDVLTVAHMERAGLQALLSYDQGFDRIPGVARQEP
jgi:predicted nucleic acid-binding protein